MQQIEYLFVQITLRSIVPLIIRLQRLTQKLPIRLRLDDGRAARSSQIHLGARLRPDSSGEFRIVDRGRNPAALPVGDVMTPNPECLSIRSAVAYALNMMSVGGFRHVPVVDDEHRPAFVISVRNVVEFLVEAFPREILNLPSGFEPSQSTREVHS